MLDQMILIFILWIRSSICGYIAENTDIIWLQYSADEEEGMKNYLALDIEWKNFIYQYGTGFIIYILVTTKIITFSLIN